MFIFSNDMTMLPEVINNTNNYQLLVENDDLYAVTQKAVS